jgi:hypothetical protein
MADVAGPHSSSPFVIVDTLGDDLSTTAVRLEGAGGWAFGALSLGLGVGFDGGERRTVASPVPRTLRVSTPGVAAGAGWHLSSAVQLGVSARWQQTTQSFLIISFAQPTRVLAFTGLSDPVPVDLVDQSFERRLERSAHALDLGVRVRFLGADLVAAGALERTTENRFPQFINDPPKDHWRARGWRGLVGVERTQIGERVRVVALIQFGKLTGRATARTQLEPQLHSREWWFSVLSEVRLRNGGWDSGLRLTTARAYRWRQDDVVGITSVTQSWSPGIELEVARELPFGLSVALGGGARQYAPWGAIPEPSSMGPLYVAFLAPEALVQATAATQVAGTLTLKWSSPMGTAVWARGTVATVSPRRGLGQLGALPPGSRRAGQIEVGVALGGS